MPGYELFRQQCNAQEEDAEGAERLMIHKSTSLSHPIQAMAGK